MTKKGETVEYEEATLRWCKHHVHKKYYGMDYTCATNQKIMKVGKNKRKNIIAKRKIQNK